jgi:hypothetical protein
MTIGIVSYVLGRCRSRALLSVHADVALDLGAAKQAAGDPEERQLTMPLLPF